MEIGLMSLGDKIDDPVTGTPFSAAERYRMTIEAAEVADRIGVHGYYIGEHHGINYTFSSPAVVLGAIATRTDGFGSAPRWRWPPISTPCSWPRTMPRST